jgi:hypothetical protein
MSITNARDAFPPEATDLRLTCLATFDNLRALAWDGDILYASRGYHLLRAKIDGKGEIKWQFVARFRPALRRKLSSSLRLTSRLFRDGFHALAFLPSGHLIAAVPGAIVTLPPGGAEFHISHSVTRGTRPLHIATTPGGRTFWGEYFDNAARDEVHIYASKDCGATWATAYTFPRGHIRHVHNVVYDRWDDCLWILTGDNGPECRILRASCDFSSVTAVLSGHQQARAVALVPTPAGLYFSSDTPFETNHIYFLDRAGSLSPVAAINSSSIYGCRVGGSVFFSTMVEPSEVNLDRNVNVYGSMDGKNWPKLLTWRKDRWPMGLFQYGNAFFPDGENTSSVLAVSPAAVQETDQRTSIWSIVRNSAF